jgi:hypothetical protein
LQYKHKNEREREREIEREKTKFPALSESTILAVQLVHAFLQFTE